MSEYPEISSFYSPGPNSRNWNVDHFEIPREFEDRAQKTPVLIQVFVFLAAALVIAEVFISYLIPREHYGWTLLVSALGVIGLVSFGIFALNRVNRQALNLKELLNIDRTTGLYSSVFLMEELDRLIEEGNHSIVLLFLDLDELKIYNDTFGHRAGDHLIRDSAEALAETVLGQGVGFRYGGDEFVAILSEVTLDVALKTAKRVQQAFRNRNISASIGLYPWRPGMNSDQLLFEADKAMYAAKKTGKDRIYVGGSESNDIDNAIQGGWI